MKCPGSFQSRITKNQKHAGMQPARGERENNVRVITIKVNEYGEYQAYYPVAGIELPIGTPFPVRKITPAKEFWNLSGYQVKVESVKACQN